MHIWWKTLLPVTNFYNCFNIMWHNVAPLKYALDFNLLANGHFLYNTSNGGNLCVYIENMLTKKHTSLSTSKILNASRWDSMKILAKVQEVTWQGLCLQQFLSWGQCVASYLERKIQGRISQVYVTTIHTIYHH